VRREQGLALTDRIVVRLPERDTDLLAYAQWISDEVLAEELTIDPSVQQPVIARA
jgi:hypothetical protein